MSVVHFSNLPNLGSGYVSLSLLGTRKPITTKIDQGEQKDLRAKSTAECERGKDRQADRGGRKQNGGAAAATLQERRRPRREDE